MSLSARTASKTELFVHIADHGLLSESSMTSLISPEDCELFSACELHAEGEFELRNPDSFAIGAVTAGNLDFGGTEVRQGGSFFLPFAVKSLQITGTGNCILIRPPRAG